MVEPIAPSPVDLRSGAAPVSGPAVPDTTSIPGSPALPVDRLTLSPAAAKALSPSQQVTTGNELLHFPFAPGDTLALVSSTLGKGVAEVRSATPQEFRIQARVHSFSDLVKTAAPMMGLTLDPQMEIPVSITRNLQGRYTLVLQIGGQELVRLDNLTAKQTGADQALVDATGQEVAYLRGVQAGHMVLDIPIPAQLLPPDMPDWQKSFLPKSIDIELTRVGTVQDSPATIQQKTRKVFSASDRPDRFTAGVAFGGEPIVSTFLGYEHTLKKFDNLARLQAGGKLLIGGIQNQIAGTIGGEISLAPWNQPFFLGANLGLYGGNFGPDRRGNIGVGPEIKAGYEKGPWQATVSYTHVWGTTGYNLVSLGMGYRF